jgi:long-chain fatty acid transport protein
MTMRARIGTGLLIGTLFGVLPLRAGNFELDPPGARAAGMGGACVAQANDPSAIFCNPGALALIPKKKGAALGADASTFNESLYQGLPPGIGAGTAAEQKKPKNILPHLFIALPLGNNAVMGAGYYHPFQLHTEWADPGNFAGRFIATSSKVETFDITPTVSMRLGDNIGIGAGLIYRSSSLSADHRVSVLSGGVAREVASQAMKSDTRRSIGYSAGLFIRPAPSFSLGASYHSATKSDATGVGRLTQITTGNAQLDQLIAATLPFNQDLLINTTIELPSQMTAGIAIGSQPLLFEVDATRTGWKKVHDIAFLFPSIHSLDTTYALGLEDTWTYRTGLRWQFPTGPQLRAGYALAKSPVPDAAVGPFFPDSDHTTISLGVGLDWLDVAAGMTTYKQRIITTSLAGLNGNYRAKTWNVSVTVTK